METIINTPKATSSRTVAGIIILLIGGGLLLDQFDLTFIPDWLFSWPLILIAIGIYSGVKHHFQNRTSFILILLGSAFYLENTDLIMSDVIWPSVLIIAGLYMISKHNFHREPKNLNGTY